jgi:hypothetical protein
MSAVGAALQPAFGSGFSGAMDYSIRRLDPFRRFNPEEGRRIPIPQLGFFFRLLASGFFLCF